MNNLEPKNMIGIVLDAFIDMALYLDEPIA